MCGIIPEKEVSTLPFCYDKLFKLLIEKKVSRKQLKEMIGCSSNTMSAMNKGKTISMANIGKICEVLDCQPGDIVEYIKECETGNE